MVQVMYLLPVKNLLSVTVFQFIADVPILMYCFVLSGIFHTNPEVMILSHPMGVSILSVTKVVDSPPIRTLFYFLWKIRAVSEARELDICKIVAWLY